MGNCISANIMDSNPPEPKIVYRSQRVIEDCTDESLSETSWQIHNKKTSIERAKYELQKRIITRTPIHSKCPVCKNIGLEISDQYYTFYLVVPSVICKTKCQKCNEFYSFEYIGMVKTFDELVCFITDEDF